ncbi:hypothetical protein N9Y95_03510, partial [Candidatus Pelagibacter bacterium]|nr:hypothetical protein [Candidatus Pelagibacter bacterium]
RQLAYKILTKYWNSEAKIFFLNRKYLHIALHKKFKKISDQYTELIHSSKIIRLNKKERIYFYAPQNFISKYIFAKYKNLKCYNVNILDFSFFGIFFGLLLKTIFLFLGYFYKFLKSNVFLRKNDKTTNVKLKKNIDQVIYFPHKGGASSLNIRENIFYSKNGKSIFFHKKLLHMEWSKKDIHDKPLVKDFYDKNKLRTDYWENYKINFINKIYILKKLLFFILKTNFSSNLLLLNIISKIFVKIETSKIKLKKYFPETKILLVQYEYNFPINLAIAAKILKLKIVSAQTRILMPAIKESYLNDLYLSIGEKSIKDIKSQIYKPKIALYGIKNFKLAKNLSSNKIIKHILVYDIKSHTSWYLNSREPEFNWRENYLFYSLILDKAKLFKNVKFYIKSKNYNWLKIPYYYKILSKIKKQKNILILNNYSDKKFNLLSKKIDLTIAIYTSGVDSMLANGKPVIIYDKLNIHKKFLDYGKLIVHSENELDSILNNFFVNYNKTNFQINKIRKLLYSKFNLSAQKEIFKLYKL